MKVDKRNPYHWLLLMQQGLYTLLASCTRYLWPRRGKPVVVLYGHQLSGNLKALYDEWNLTRRQNFECYFLSLDPRYSKDLRKDGIQVLQCCRLGDMLLVGRASAIITDHGLHAMRSFLTLTDIYFIDVWHGIPYKGFTSENFRVQHRYREIWVSSPKGNSSRRLSSCRQVGAYSTSLPVSAIFSALRRSDFGGSSRNSLSARAYPKSLTLAGLKPYCSS